VKGGDHLEDPGIDGRVILSRFLRTRRVGHGLDRSGWGWGQVTVCCEYHKERTASIKCWDSPE